MAYEGICFCMCLKCFALFLLCFAMFLYVFDLFCYVSLCFCYVLLCFCYVLGGRITHYSERANSRTRAGGNDEYGCGPGCPGTDFCHLRDGYGGKPLRWGSLLRESTKNRL